MRLYTSSYYKLPHIQDLYHEFLQLPFLINICFYYFSMPIFIILNMLDKNHQMKQWLCWYLELSMLILSNCLLLSCLHLVEYSDRHILLYLCFFILDQFLLIILTIELWAHNNLKPSAQSFGHPSIHTSHIPMIPK